MYIYTLGFGRRKCVVGLHMPLGTLYRFGPSISRHCIYRCDYLSAGYSGAVTVVTVVTVLWHVSVCGRVQIRGQRLGLYARFLPDAW